MDRLYHLVGFAVVWSGGLALAAYLVLELLRKFGKALYSASDFLQTFREMHRAGKFWTGKLSKRFPMLRNED